MIWVYYVTMTLFVIICLIMIMLVLIQKGRGGGLSSSFGGGGGGNTAFGAKTGDVLTWATSVVFALFIVLAVVLNLVSNKLDAQTKQMTGAPTQSVPAGPSTPAPGA